MCEVVATLPDDIGVVAVATPATDHFKKAAERMVAETIVAIANDWKEKGWGNRPTWYIAALMSARHVATRMANTEEMRDAMAKAFDQSLAAYGPL